MYNPRMARLLLLIFIVSTLGCESDNAKKTKVLRLAVTTSTRDSGLLEAILPAFKATHNIQVNVLAVGTGAALKLGEAGDVDAILCHAREQELEFLRAGHGVRHEPVMRNSFVVLGPASDPAGIRGKAAAAGLASIRDANQPFVSRGDRSGTHQRELLIWKEASGEPKTWDAYFETGQGMGNSLTIANQKQAYVLCDFGTYLNFRSKISLEPIIQSGNQLENPYGVLVVNPEKNAQVQSELASKFVDFLISPETQAAIGDYRIDGESLFHPAQNVGVE